MRAITLVGYGAAVQPMPNGDRLLVLQADDGSELYNVPMDAAGADALGRALMQGRAIKVVNALGQEIKQ